MVEATDVVRNTAVEGIARGVKSGREYRRGNISHIASAPGQFPATDTGRLVSSISTQVSSVGNKVEGKIIAEAPYAAHLEFGTKDMEARPFMQPSLTKNKRKIETIFRRKNYVK